MISVKVGSGDVHEYAIGISAGEVIENVHGRSLGLWLLWLMALKGI